MRIRWLGQSAFVLRDGAATVVVDPWGAIDTARVRWDYAPFDGIEADLLVVTHEHIDHNGVERVAGTPHVVRSTAGTFDTPVGELVSVASEHDDVAGTRRGANTIVVFTLGGRRVCHCGDLGQPRLRPEQRAAIGEIDVLMLPVGGNATIGGETSAELVRALAPQLVVPMHYRTAALDILDPPDGFLAAVPDLRVERFDASELSVEDHVHGPPLVALLAPPLV